MLLLDDKNEAYKLIQKLHNSNVLKEYDLGYYLPDVVRLSNGPIKERSAIRTHARKKDERDQRLKNFEHGLMSTWDQELGEGEI